MNRAGFTYGLNGLKPRAAKIRGRQMLTSLMVRRYSLSYLQPRESARGRESLLIPWPNTVIESNEAAVCPPYYFRRMCFTPGKYNPPPPLYPTHYLATLVYSGINITDIGLCY
ncbi:hypothetical protein J6590_035895 [Homalodisca vitripennis]|nr:hypothetical protein J6590_035895 [Homalodisca vitripennis]